MVTGIQAWSMFGIGVSLPAVSGRSGAGGTIAMNVVDSVYQCFFTMFSHDTHICFLIGYSQTFTPISWTTGILLAIDLCRLFHRLRRGDRRWGHDKAFLLRTPLFDHMTNSVVLEIDHATKCVPVKCTHLCNVQARLVKLPL